jgi:hypothetical protein
MDTSSKQQRTYEEAKRESRKRNGKRKELETETGKGVLDIQVLCKTGRKVL